MSIENGSPVSPVETPENKVKSIDTPITQTLENVRMVNNIDIQNPEEKALEVRDASADINIEMTGKGVTKNATTENISKVLNDPEKAKSLFTHLGTVGKLVETLGEKFLDKTDTAVEAINAKIIGLYKEIQKDKVDAVLKTVATVGVIVAMKAMFEALQINGGSSEYIPPEKAEAFASAMTNVAVGFGTFVASINAKAAREGFFNGFFKKSK